MSNRAFNLIILVVWIVLSVSLHSSAEQQNPSGAQDFFEMSIEELMKVEVASTATLTETSPRLVPAAMTTITREQIKDSGARSLDELLEIYVPNLQIALHLWEPQHLGLRGRQLLALG
jgi:outer membrane receptor protein involved in Fe transport